MAALIDPAPPARTTPIIIAEIKKYKKYPKYEITNRDIFKEFETRV